MTTREELVKAAAYEIHRSTCGCDRSLLHSRDRIYGARASAAVNAVLPLIADAIEARGVVHALGTEYREGLQDGYWRAARLVRQLGQDDTE